MRIAFVCQPWEVLNPAEPSGSIPILTDELARRLAASCDVVVFGRRGLTGLHAITHRSVRYRRMRLTPIDLFLRPLSRIERLLDYPRRRLPFFGSALYALGYALQVAIAASRERCDVIHIHNFSQFVPVIRAFNRSASIVLHMHCEWLGQLDERALASRLRHVDAVVGCSDYVSAAAARRFDWLAERCVTVHNGCDVTTFGPGTAVGRGGRLLFVGRVSPEKGVHVLLAALRALISTRPNVRLEVVGPIGAAPYEYIVLLDRDVQTRRLARYYGRARREDQYADAIHRMGEAVRGHVTFSGAIRYSELAERYRAADIVVVPSVWNEPAGLPVYEAMASGRPVVATRGGGIPEAVTHATGILVKRDEPEELAAAIARLLDAPDVARRMGEAGRERVEAEFTWDHSAAALLALYRQLVPLSPRLSRLGGARGPKQVRAIDQQLEPARDKRAPRSEARSDSPHIVTPNKTQEDDG